MFAVIKTGGKQYRVSKDDVVTVEKLAADPGETVQFNDVLMIGGDSLTVGAPMIEGAGVQAEVVEQELLQIRRLVLEGMVQLEPFPHEVEGLTGCLVDLWVDGIYVKAGLSPIEPQYRCNSVNLVRKLVLNTDAVAPLVTTLVSGFADERDQ